MPDFSIMLGDEIRRNEDDPAALGMIALGDFQENFHASLSYWNQERYRSQWRQALERLTSGAWQSALITSMYDPDRANFIVWWPIYRDGYILRIQNQVLFLTDLAQPFDEADPYNSIQPRETRSEDDFPVSEWSVKLSDIQRFLAD